MSGEGEVNDRGAFIHESAYVDEGASGAGHARMALLSRSWGATIGEVARSVRTS